LNENRRGEPLSFVRYKRLIEIFLDKGLLAGDPERENLFEKVKALNPEMYQKIINQINHTPNQKNSSALLSK